MSTQPSSGSFTGTYALPRWLRWSVDWPLSAWPDTTRVDPPVPAVLPPAAPLESQTTTTNPSLSHSKNIVPWGFGDPFSQTSSVAFARKNLASWHAIRELTGQALVQATVPEPLRPGVAALAPAMVATACTYPLATLATAAQAKPFVGIRTLAADIWTTNGYRGFWAGLSSILARSVPQRTAQLGTSMGVHAELVDRGIAESHARWAAAVAAGFIDSTIMSSAEKTSIERQLSSSNPPIKINSAAAFYRGVFLRDQIAAWCMLTLPAEVRQHLGLEETPAHRFGSIVASVSLGNLITTPCDVLKLKGGITGQSMRTILYNHWQQNEMRALLSGYLPRACRLSLSAALTVEGTQQIMHRLSWNTPPRPSNAVAAQGLAAAA